MSLTTHSPQLELWDDRTERGDLSIIANPSAPHTDDELSDFIESEQLATGGEDSNTRKPATTEELRDFFDTMRQLLTEKGEAA